MPLKRAAKHYEQYINSITRQLIYYCSTNTPLACCWEIHCSLVHLLSSICLQKVKLSTEDAKHTNFKFDQFSFTVHECPKNVSRMLPLSPPPPQSDFGLHILHNMQFLFCKLHEQL